MAEEKTISYLNSKVWYRLLKLIFILAVTITLLAFNIKLMGGSKCDFISSCSYNPAWMIGSGLLLFFIVNIAIIFISEILKRIFYYIVLGNFFPKK